MGYNRDCSHAFLATKTDIQPIAVFPGVSLTKIISPVREKDTGNAFPMVEDLSYVVIDSGARTTPHILSGISEAVYIISGNVRAHVNGSMVDTAAGQALFIPEDTIQSIENTGESPLVYISILDRYYSEEAEVIIDAGATAEVSDDSVQSISGTGEFQNPGSTSIV